MDTDEHRYGILGSELGKLRGQPLAGFRPFHRTSLELGFVDLC
jgi:hypothetical protein